MIKNIQYLIAFALLIGSLAAAPAAVPSVINYQGRLTDASGVPQSGTRAMALKIYNDAVKGQLLYSENLGSVALDANGVYGFQFGTAGENGTGTIASALATSTEQWLELAVDGVSQTPRQRILAVPFAMVAGCIPDGPRNVRNYGAKGDGITDDTAAINAAIAATTGIDRQVYFPPGTYKCNLVISHTIHLVGAGAWDLGDWTGLDKSLSVLVPNSDAAPVIRFSALRNSSISQLEIRGNGAGTSAYGICIGNTVPGAYPGSGLTLRNSIVRRCTNNIYNNGGCNILIESCGIQEGNFDIIGVGSLATSYTINNCCIGGTPATGHGRCFDFSEVAHVNISGCEQGNCTDYLVARSLPNITIMGGNWETFSGTVLLTMEAGTLNWIGGRVSTPLVRTVVRAKGTNVVGVNLMGVDIVSLASGGCLYDSNSFMGQSIKGCRNGNIAFYSGNFATLLGSGTYKKIRVRAARTRGSNQIVANGDRMIFDYEYEDNASTYNNTTGVFTAPRSGYYRVSYCAKLGAVSAWGFVIHGYINGIQDQAMSGLTTAAAGTFTQGSSQFFLPAGGTLDLRMINSSSVTLTASSYMDVRFNLEEIEQ